MRIWLTSGVCLLVGFVAGHVVTIVSTEPPPIHLPSPPSVIFAPDPDRELRAADASQLATAKSMLRDWEKFAVPQRSLPTGCIPAGYEYLLKSAGVEGPDFTTFQEEFDLGPEVNNLYTIAEAVK